MKKALSLLLAVVLVCSMATVAFAIDYSYVCGVCGGTTSSPAEYNEHVTKGGCGKCAYCGQGFNAVEIKNHQENVCRDFAGTCDYCGKTDEDVTDHGTEAEFKAHVAACKTNYHNIPLAKIIATVKDLISKIDFSKVFGTVKDLAGKAVPVVKDLIGKIDFSAIKLPA